jgi:hypothetical protein
MHTLHCTYLGVVGYIEQCQLQQTRAQYYQRHHRILVILRSMLTLPSMPRVVPCLSAAFTAPKQLSHQITRPPTWRRVPVRCVCGVCAVVKSENEREREKEEREEGDEWHQSIAASG